MRDVLAAYPGARRALFRKYHIGGCSSRGLAPAVMFVQAFAPSGRRPPTASAGCLLWTALGVGFRDELHW